MIPWLLRQITSAAAIVLRGGSLALSDDALTTCTLTDTTTTTLTLTDTGNP